MGSFSLAHWLIVFVVLMLVFGPSKLGQLGKGMGEGIKNFKKALNDDAETPPGKQIGSGDKSA